MKIQKRAKLNKIPALMFSATLLSFVFCLFRSSFFSICSFMHCSWTSPPHIPRLYPPFFFSYSTILVPFSYPFASLSSLPVLLSSPPLRSFFQCYIPFPFPVPFSPLHVSLLSCLNSRLSYPIFSPLAKNPFFFSRIACPILTYHILATSFLFCILKLFTCSPPLLFLSFFP